MEGDVVSRRRPTRSSRSPEADVLRLPIVCSHGQPPGNSVSRLGTVDYFPAERRVHVDTTDSFYGAEDPYVNANDPLQPHFTWPFRCRKCGENRPLTSATLDLVVPVYADLGIKRVDLCTVSADAATLRKQ